MYISVLCLRIFYYRYLKHFTPIAAGVPGQKFQLSHIPSQQELHNSESVFLK